MQYNKLTPAEERVIIDKGTEPPFTGEFVKNHRHGIYLCKRCNAELYRQTDQFNSHCGWASFDDEIAGAITRIPEADGKRTEIVCANCGGHLGHVFLNEGYTDKQIRHCVNSISMKFVPTPDSNTETAYFSSGCFWGTEYYFLRAEGVKHTTVGYMGGTVEYPTYEDVCSQTTGHLETTELLFDKRTTSYEAMVRLFFETHDFTQTNGQGPDIGSQYLSCIFYTSEEQRQIAQHHIDLLTQKGYKVATMLREASHFWRAENYHQQYYHNKGGRPYCHSYKKIF